ncbi:hypothetical protein K2X92_03560 [Candidatus Gracilibacteria bacterium]|nr:hypothetical protein [Candidatus Gracilibacteria bacterium]
MEVENAINTIYIKNGIHHAQIMREIPNIHQIVSARTQPIPLLNIHTHQAGQIKYIKYINTNTPG